MTDNFHLSYLDQLEAESITMLREMAAGFDNPVMLYSIGKDSSVMLHLAKKAFAPGKIPFPLMHIDTGYKPSEMITFRDKTAEEIGANLIVKKNMSNEAQAFTAGDAHTDAYIYHKKTKPLLNGLLEHGFDAAAGGARREEEKSRAKERVFSVRDAQGTWDPKRQRPELWSLYNTNLAEGETMRVFPLSNWTEMDIWAYIIREQIDIVPLYFAQERQVLNRHGIYIRVDEYNVPKDGEEVTTMWSRYRTLGCSPSTGVIASKATTLEEILQEVIDARESERQNRAIDATSEASMEAKKREGYF